MHLHKVMLLVTDCMVLQYILLHDIWYKINKVTLTDDVILVQSPSIK